MEVKVKDISSGELLNARIIDQQCLNTKLPSFNDGWRFDFCKHAKKKGYKVFALCCDDTPEIIEGCLIFEMKNLVEPYMAFVEVAPHNKGTKKQKDYVAGCPIAFACRLSFIHGKEDYNGWLAFDVLEENKRDEIKLMALYSTKYGALKFDQTTMVIPPEGGEKLINEFIIRSHEK